MRLGAELAQAVAAELLLVSVVEVPTLELAALVSNGGFDLAQMEVALVADREKLLARGKEQSAAAGVSARSVVLLGNPADEIIKCARENQAYLIVTGSRGQGGFERLVLGSVAQAIVAHADIPVVVAK